jgi:putative Mn2+ efflux pump MntP
MRGLPRRERLRVSLLMSSFEMAMPVVGVLIGDVFGRLVGGAANGIARSRCLRSSAFGC